MELNQIFFKDLNHFVSIYKSLIDEEAQSMEANTREGIIFKYARYAQVCDILFLFYQFYVFT